MKWQILVLHWTSPNCCHKVGIIKLSKLSWYADASRVPFTGSKGLRLTLGKQPHIIIPPRPNFLLGTVRSYKYHYPGNHQTQTLPSDYQREKLNLSLQRTFLHCFRVACFTPSTWDALHCTWWCKAVFPNYLESRHILIYYCYYITKITRHQPKTSQKEYW